MDNNELNNSALDKQLFTDDSLNNFGQGLSTNDTIIEPNTSSMDMNSNLNTPNQSLNNVNMQTIPNDQTQTISNNEQINLTNNSLNKNIEPSNNTIFDNTSVVNNVQEPVVEPSSTTTQTSSYTNEVKQKKSKGPVVLIIFLLLIVLGLAGYIAYDKFLSKDNTSKDIEEKENNGLTTLTDTKLIENLRSELVASNNINSLYYNNIKATDISNKNLIGFNIVKYIGDNNITLNENGGVYKDSGYTLNLTIPKTNIDEYINNKYNTNSNYTYISKDNNDSLLTIGCSAVLSDESNYYYVTIPTGCGASKINTKLIKAEEDKDNVYIYDKYIKCASEAGWMGCSKSEDEVLGQNSFISCTEGTNTNEKCPLQGTVDELSNYVLENMKDKLKTFKHTFKKLDGNYFWVSSEVVE